MTAILLTYDLKKPGQDYGALHDAIKSLGTWWHYLESTWIVSAPGLTPQRTFEVVRPHLDTTDHLLALDVSHDAHQGWLPTAAWEWINQHL